MSIEEVLQKVMASAGLPAFFIYAWYVQLKMYQELQKRYLDLLEKLAMQPRAVAPRGRLRSEINERVEPPDMSLVDMD